MEFMGTPGPHTLSKTEVVTKTDIVVGLYYCHAQLHV